MTMRAWSWRPAACLGTLTADFTSKGLAVSNGPWMLHTTSRPSWSSCLISWRGSGCEAARSLTCILRALSEPWSSSPRGNWWRFTACRGRIGRRIQVLRSWKGRPSKKCFLGWLWTLRSPLPQLGPQLPRLNHFLAGSWATLSASSWQWKNIVGKTLWPHRNGFGGATGVSDGSS